MTKYMKQLFLSICIIMLFLPSAFAQQDTEIREYIREFKTYPFSDPDPITHIEPLRKVGKIYPYSRFDGYTDNPVNKEWKVIELENEYIKVMILPEIGGKVWSAIEKSTGKEFIYYNHVVKFRDVALRGPWTSGGIEYNYGIVGHAPNCSTPVDYKIVRQPDGSASCIIGVFDLLTRSFWRIDVNLPKDKAYFTTNSYWYNASSTEQPYYTWMNAGIKSDGNLQFVFPGNKWIEHNGIVSNWWPYNEDGIDVSFYENNDFGGYKSYHVFGEHSGFFGGYWHDDDFGMGRYSTRDDKAGKKIWLWGLSNQGMIWEKLLTDNDGQYVELQSGRLFNQTWPLSTYTPFKHYGFLPYSTDKWTEYWFPMVKTKGYVAANNHGALNLKNEKGWLKIYLSPLEEIRDRLTISVGDITIYEKSLSLKPLELFSDSIQINSENDLVRAVLGDNKLEYQTSGNELSRPVTSPVDFNWESVYGLFLQGKEKIHERDYIVAEEKLRACLEKDPYYLPALTNMSMLLCRRMKYNDALEFAKKALSVNTYDPAANYYYGLINYKAGNIADAKDGFEIASMGIEYRSSSFSMLSMIYLKQGNFKRSVEYAWKSIDYNQYAVNAYQTLSVNYRMLNDREEANRVLDTLMVQDKLSHLARFEKYLWDSTDDNKKYFTELIKNEIHEEVYLELAIWYNNIGREKEAITLLNLAPQTAKISYWRACLTKQPLDNLDLKPETAFPFRQETAEILESLIQRDDNWFLKYHLALIHWDLNNITDSEKYFSLCGNIPDYSPFYAARAEFSLINNIETLDALSDLKHAVEMDPDQWRHGRHLAEYYLSRSAFEEALKVAEKYYGRFPENYYLGLIYAKALLKNNFYKKAANVLNLINVLPNEGATEGRKLYKETQLMLALEEMGKNNFRKALEFIEVSRQWPENLGVGKPYESDIDERLEDWLAYKCYTELGDRKSAQENLERILSFKPQKTAYINTFSSANNLVTAWVLQISGKITEAEDYLNDWISREPSNALPLWAMNIFKGNNYPLPDEKDQDENYRLLKNYLQRLSNF
jgi:predicted Zn-dependent protease